MPEGVLELHWQREPWGELHMALYERSPHGALACVGEFDQAPFDGPGEATRWLLRALVERDVTPSR